MSETRLEDIAIELMGGLLVQYGGEMRLYAENIFKGAGKAIAIDKLEDEDLFIIRLIDAPTEESDGE